MKYDIRTEPWIPVRSLDGIAHEISLCDLFAKAHELKDIDCATPMETYSLYRFLTVFLMDVYRPDTWEERVDILDEGFFDVKKIEAYVDECEQAGVSFDIFDKDKPFLQAPADKTWDTEKNIKYVATLDSTRASGNNAIHFDHKLESLSSFTPAEAFRCVLTAQMFCTAMSGGYPSGVNGAPPLYFLPKGHNLFETLILSLTEIDEENSGVPLWRSDRDIVPKEEVVKTSQLYGMFFPSRRIRLIEHEGMVKQMFYQPGLNFTGYAGWNDPHVAYRRGKDDIFTSIKPSVEKEPWRNIKTISEDYENGSVPAVINDFYQIQEEKGSYAMPVQILGVVTSNASYLDTQSGMMILDTRIISNEDKRKYVANYIDMAENIGYILGKSLENIISPDDSKRGINEVKQYVHRFYMECERKFYEIMDDLAVSDGIEAENSVSARWKENLRRIVLNIVQELEKNYCYQSKDLIRAQQYERILMGSVNKIIKGGRSDE
ncbi:type I-E CRISPR-associated protein Cse1/CasA [Selenomonas sp. KH1T6]|uniref:type I-E CRISPR-associated protein Cse1/CasA n=1 Tax=Selenomonas sp. KH1T6 TaxID=3158784 RepID=UPI0008A80946|nr:CRISPR-associated protein, Cse1 family [Selenomonas ruminantium]